MTDFLKEEENKIVFSALKDIEEKYNVKVIFAVEAGSKSGQFLAEIGIFW
jgi:hypothetical protein